MNKLPTEYFPKRAGFDRVQHALFLFLTISLSPLLSAEKNAPETAMMEEESGTVEELSAIKNVDKPDKSKAKKAQPFAPPLRIFLERAFAVTDIDGNRIELSPGSYIIDRIDLKALSLEAKDGDTRAIIIAEPEHSESSNKRNTADIVLDDGAFSIHYVSREGDSFRVPLQPAGAMSRSIVIYPDPDVVALNLSTSPSTLYTDRNITFKAYIKAVNRSVNNVRFWLFPCANLSRENYGYRCFDYVSMSGSGTSCYVNNGVALDCTIDQIPVDEARRVDINVRLKSIDKQTPTALLNADSYNQISETDENNNKRTRSYTAHRRADLAVEYCGNDSVTICYPNNGINFQQGLSGNIKWDITNPGSQETANIKLKFRTPLFYLNDVVFSPSTGHGFTCTRNRTYGTAECTGGSMGGTKPSSIRVTLRVQAKTLIPSATYASDLNAEIDPDNTIINEVSESNNAVTQRAWIRGY